MSEAQLTSYEHVPYDSKPLYPTHPDCMAALATLMGMQPANIERCRVLELGCATGGNLIPMAESLPAARFVGIDLSPSQIASGRNIVEGLGLTNIDLRAVSILDVDESFGTFDYIICHGVYSWVPPAVQNKILDICARHLSDQGVAYVSYNTYPGWHARGMVREMMGFHARQFDQPETRVQQARAFLEFLTDSTLDRDSAYSRALREEAELLRPEADYYLFHEHLEDVNQPLYFHQFAQRLTSQRLQYLGEAWQHTNLANFTPEVRDTLERLSGDLVHLEQYIDFLGNRTFRRTLLCHEHVRLSRAPSAKIIAGLKLSTMVRPIDPQPSAGSTEAAAFRADDGATVSTNIPVVKAALACLFDAWPAPLSFDALWDAVRVRLENVPRPDAEIANSPEFLAESLLQCYLSGMVAFHACFGRFVRAPGERPIASPLARWQAAHGKPITNRRHRIIELGPSDRLLLGYLDGSRDRAALGRALANDLDASPRTWVARDAGLAAELLPLQEQLRRAEDAGQRQELLERWIAASLYRMAQGALIVH